MSTPDTTMEPTVEAERQRTPGAAARERAAPMVEPRPRRRPGVWWNGLVAFTAAVDALIIFDAFAVAYLLRFRLHLFAVEFFEPARVSEYLKAIAVVSYCWILLFAIFGLYDLKRHRAGIDLVHLIVKAVTAGTLVILSLTYFYRDFSFSRLVCVFAWAISVSLFLAFRLAIHHFVAGEYRRGHNLRQVITIGSRSLARFLVDKIRRQPELGYRVLGLVDRKPPEDELAHAPYLGDLNDLDHVLETRDVDGVLIADPTLGHFDLLEIIQCCERRGVAIRMVPATYDLLVNYRDVEDVDGMPIVKVNEQEYRRCDDLLKRIFDLAVGAPLFLVSLPLWGMIALAIRREDGGAVFFRQLRVGRDGRLFTMWKFRTMVGDAEDRLQSLLSVAELPEPVFKLEKDPRVTGVGRFLRRFSLDELPQLLNVLRGDMSLVGPRPEEAKLVERYDVWERRRLKALPGITGLQQIKCRGSTNLRERVGWDVLYLRKRSLLLDTWILVRTVWTVLGGRGAT